VYLIEVLAAQSLLDLERAGYESNKMKKEEYVTTAVNSAEEAVKRAKQLVANHPEKLRMTPDDEPPNTRDETRYRFDDRRLTLEVRAQSVFAAAIAANLPNSALIKARVKALWDEVDLQSIPRDKGGPSDEQKSLYINRVLGK
jgi:hypothetical protein